MHEWPSFENEMFVDAYFVACGGGFPGGSDSKELACQCRRRKKRRFDPWMGEEDPLEMEMATQTSILAQDNPMDRGAWWAPVHGITELDATGRLTHTPCGRPRRFERFKR